MMYNLPRRTRRQGRRTLYNFVRPALEELEGRLTPSGTPVLQYHNDLASTGQNLNETILTTSNVNSGSFGKLFSTAVDGQVYAQPLFLSGVSIAGGTHNVVFAATEHDTVYALDADSGAVLWQKNYLQAGERTRTSNDVGTTDITPQIGITGTPVIDSASGTIYFVTKATTAPTGTNASTSNTVQRLHAVDVATGNEKFGGPVVIQASVNGTGSGNDGHGHVPFDALRNNQRMGLILSGGVIYITWASHGDNGPYHGWVIGYNASTLQQIAAFNDTPNGVNGGIWESGGAVSADSSGNLYLTTGNGTFDTTLNSSGMPNQHDFGDSVLKLAVDPTSTPTNQNGNGWGLKVADYFTPFNQATLEANDADLGSGGILILPDSAGSTAHRHLMVIAGKEGKIYLIDRDNMGHFDPNTDHVVQEVPGALNAELGNPAFFNGDLYYATPGFGTDVAKEFSIANGALSTAPVSRSNDTFSWRGGTTSVSANGTSNGIVWALDGGSNQLRAYSAANLGTELYTSAQAANNRDQLGSVVKFTVPTVSNGHVYVGVNGALVGYGLLNTAHVITVDDAVQGTGQNQFNYVGAWTHVVGTNIPNSFDGTVSYTDTTNDSVTISFTGTQIKLYVAERNNRGLAGVSIDGGAETLVDEYRAQDAGNVLVYTSPVPTSGLHTLKVRNTGTHHAASSGFRVDVDRVDIIQAVPGVQVSLAGAFNQVGIVSDGSTFTGGLDGGGSALSGNLLGTGRMSGGAFFNLGAVGGNNVVSAAGQTINLPAGSFSSLRFLATAVNGNQPNQTFTVTYTDGTTATFTQGISDWFTPQNFAGESDAVDMAYRDLSNGTKDNRTFHVYGYSFALNPAKTVKSITLPNNGNVKILAVTLM
jgi:hypothetical protein